MLVAACKTEATRYREEYEAAAPGYKAALTAVAAMMVPFDGPECTTPPTEPFAPVHESNIGIEGLNLPTDHPFAKLDLQAVQACTRLGREDLELLGGPFDPAKSNAGTIGPHVNRYLAAGSTLTECLGSAKSIVVIERTEKVVAPKYLPADNSFVAGSLSSRLRVYDPAGAPRCVFHVTTGSRKNVKVLSKSDAESRERSLLVELREDHAKRQLSVLTGQEVGAEP